MAQSTLKNFHLRAAQMHFIVAREKYGKDGGKD
jgi:hypothetical protein